MSYFKTGLGLTLAEIRSGTSLISQASKDRASGIVATEESIKHLTEEQAFVGSLKTCKRDDGKPGWLYTNRYGVVTCTANPVGDRKNELRGALAIVPPLISNPVRWKDGKWIPIIPIAPPRVDKNYFRLLLNALSNPAAAAAANKARVSWEATKDGVAYSTGRPMSQAEVETAVNTMHKDYSEGGKYYGKTKKAFIKLNDRQALRKHMLIRAVELQGTAQEAAAPAEYAAAQAEVRAKQSKMLIYVAGGVGLLVVGALVLKKKGK